MTADAKDAAAAETSDVPPAPKQPQPLEFRTLDATTGLMIADIRLGGDGNKKDSSLSSSSAATAATNASVVQSNSKINVHITGRLLGKNGWIFENSHVDGEPYRLQLGTGTIVPGLEWGLLGMAEGGIRRIVVPSPQGYLNKQLEPIPREFGQSTTALYDRHEFDTS